MIRHVALAATLILAGCSAASDNADETGADPAALVSLATATVGATTRDVTLFGAAEPGPGTESTLTAPADAIVASVSVGTGSTVRAGQAIVALRPSPTVRAELARAASDARLADSALARARRLRADGLASDADVETARAAASSARASLNTGIGARGKVLTAPRSGVVRGLTVKPGDQVAAGTAIATVAGSGDLRARYGADPMLAQHLHTGQPIEIAPVAGGGSIRTVIIGVDTQVDPNSRLAAIYVRVPPDIAASPGEPMRARVAAAPSANGVTVPYAALLDDGGQAFVFVVADGVAHRRDVVPGATSGDRVAITKGVKEGEAVITQGGTAVEDGMRVRTK